MTAADMLAFWRALIARAHEGDEQLLLFYVTMPATERSVRNADGTRTTLRTWHDIPGEVRQELVDVLVGLRNRRGRRPKFDKGTASVIRSLHTENVERHKVTATASRNRLAKRLDVSIDTMDDLLKQRKTYAPDKKLNPRSQAKRLRK